MKESVLASPFQKMLIYERLALPPHKQWSIPKGLAVPHCLAVTADL